MYNVYVQIWCFNGLTWKNMKERLQEQLVFTIKQRLELPTTGHLRSFRTSSKHIQNIKPEIGKLWNMIFPYVLWLISYMFWLVVLTILKNMNVNFNGKDYPIYEMEHKIRVPNHQFIPSLLCAPRWEMNVTRLGCSRDLKKSKPQVSTLPTARQRAAWPI